MGSFSKVPKAVLEAFDSAFNGTSLGRIIDGFAAAEASEERDIQAFHGGCRDFHNVEAIRALYREKRIGAAKDARVYLGQIVEKVTRAADEAMAVDMARAAELAPVASLALTDADVLALARQHREDRTTLLVLSRSGDTKAARRLGAALAHCDDELTTWVEKISRFGNRTIDRKNDVRTASGFSAVVHQAAEKMDAAWEELADVIGGQMIGNSAADALLVAGGRRA